MDGVTFDRIAKQLSLRRTRRQSLALAVAGVTAGAISTRARDAQELEAAQRFPRNCEYFSITGSRRKMNKKFNYDDDMVITLIRDNGTREVLLRDNDGLIGIDLKPVPPVKFEAKVGDELRIVVRDRQFNCYSLKKLFLHCCTNKRCNKSRAVKKLTKGVKEKCFTEDKWKPRKFFDEVYDIK